MNRKQNTAIYLRMATPPREQKAWVYASAKEYQRTEPMETAIALLTKSAKKTGIWWQEPLVIWNGRPHPWNDPACKRCSAP